MALQFSFKNPVPTMLDAPAVRQFGPAADEPKAAPAPTPVAKPAAEKKAAVPAKDTFDTEFDKYMEKVKPFADSVEEARAKSLQAQAAVDQARANVEMQVLQGKADEATLNAKKQKEIIDSQDKLRQEYPAFAPEQDNLTNLGNLFSLITTLGVMSGGGGKLGAQNAMAAMTGMLKGYNEGNTAEFARQKAIFDENIKAVDAHNAQVEKDLRELMEIQKSDYEAATVKREMIIRREGSQSIIGKQLEAGNATAALQTAESKQRVAEAILKQISDAQEKANTLAYQRQTSWGRPGAGGTRTSVLLAGRADNIREAVVQIAGDIKNATKFPPNTVLGAFSGMTGQSGEGLISSLSNTFARNITSNESRMLEQLITGLDQNMAMALGGGYAASAAKSRVDGYKAQAPKAGDDGYVVANWLARVRQEMDILADNFASKPGATEDMNAKVQEAVRSIDQSVPFTVEDVQDAFYSGKAPPTSPRSIGSQSIPKVTTKAEYDALPSGSLFEEDGKRYRKP